MANAEGQMPKIKKAKCRSAELASGEAIAFSIRI